MPKAIEVATELRRVADALAQNPETNVQTGWLTFYCDDKDVFISTVKSLPKPLSKRYDDEGRTWDRVHVERKTPALEVDCSIYRSKVCTLVAPATPAEYRCEPLLSEEEESTLTSAE